MKVFGIALFSALLTSFALFSADPPGLASAGGGSLDSDDETLQTAMKKVEKYTAQAKKMASDMRALMMEGSALEAKWSVVDKIPLEASEALKKFAERMETQQREMTRIHDKLTVKRIELQQIIDRVTAAPQKPAIASSSRRPRQHQPVSNWNVMFDDCVERTGNYLGCYRDGY